MLPRTPLTETVGFALVRIVVPLWILMGVVFKMQAGTAANLPSNIVDFVRPYGPAAMDATLYTLIGLEIFAILVMVGIARLARPMAVFMLTVFTLILIGEFAKGAEKCGCFGGTINIEPWQMLIADGLLLIGVILFPPPKPGLTSELSTPGLTSEARKTRILTPKLLATTAGALIIGLAASFIIGHTLHGIAPPEQIEQDDDAPTDPTINPAAKPVPRNWYPQNLPSWVGRPWREVEIFQFMPRWPEGFDEGVHYIVFYSRTCSHCEVMFYDDFTRPLGAPVIAIEIPATRTELTSTRDDAWDLPPIDPSVTLTNLPVGPDWSLLTPPLALRIEGGLVACAEEGDHKKCFEME